jgi:hypothetical protein
MNLANISQCVDITFADPKDVAEVNASNCFNSSDISFNNVFSMAQKSSSAVKRIASFSLLPVVFFGALYALL